MNRLTNQIPGGLSRCRTGVAAVVGMLLAMEVASQAAEGAGAPAVESAAAEGVRETFYIRQFRVRGAKTLPRVDVEGAVYRYMGPECTFDHVDKARMALEKAYHDKGFTLVSVSVPGQEVKHGVVYLEVTEGRIGRLRVHGSRYFDIEKIKAKAPSLAEGTVPNFNEVQRDIIALNRNPDRQVIVGREQIRPGSAPGTYDVELLVKDKLPLHGSLELNNRKSPDTTDLRINGSISYGNLWQAGHAAGLSIQAAPENTDDALVFSGYYTMPVEQMEGVSLTFSGTKQDSDISTLGGTAVAGRGYVLGVHATKTLPPGKSYYHTLTGGVDYKNFDQDIRVAGSVIKSPLEYCPFTLTYSGTRVLENSSTDVNANLVFSFRNFGSDTRDFDDRRYKADSSFIYLRADASHTRDLQNGVQLFGKVQGQISSGPLANSEQLSGGGLSSARGYLESTALGDNGVFGSLEVRSASFIPIPRGEGGARPTRPNEWRIYGFVDAGVLSNYDPLPDQASTFHLASVGLGTRFRIRDRYTGSLDAGYPLVKQGATDAGDITVTFRVGADF